MGCRSRESVRIRRVLFAVSVCAFVAACSGGVEDTGDKSLVVQVDGSSIVVGNETGASLSKGEITVMPQGIPRPYVVLLPFMSNGTSRTFPLNQFRSSDGTPFRTDLARGKSVKVTASDVSGKTYAREIPFE